MSLSHNDVVRLLMMVTALDDTPTSEAKVSAWKAMAEEGQWESFEAAKRALVVYRTEHPDYPLRPGHITLTLERVRERASRTYTPPTDRDIPDNVLADPAAYQRHMREAARRHQDAVMAAFAGGQRVLAIEVGS